MTSQSNAILSTIKSIYEIILDEYSKSESENISNLDNFWTDKLVLPSTRDQTKDAFILRGYYGHLGSYIQTPLGEFNTGESASSSSVEGRKELHSNLIKRLGLKLIEEEDYDGGSRFDESRQCYVPKRRDHMGLYGPWYLVTKLDDIDLKYNLHSKKGNGRSSGAHYDYYKNEKHNISFDEAVKIWSKRV